MTHPQQSSKPAPPFAMQQHDDGQVYITDAEGRQMLHAELEGFMETTVQVGIDGRVTIDKLYGPLVFWPIRVSLDAGSCEWVIEREFGQDGGWREVARIPGQLAEDFPNG